MRVGIVGCGDFLRWQEPVIRASHRVRVTRLFDPVAARAESWASKFGASTSPSATALMNDPEVDLILLFVPPWAREDGLTTAVASGKPVLTTKPLAPSSEACVRILQMAGTHPVGVIYNRTDNAEIEGLKSALDSGEFGHLTLYKQDWIHHYPQWNDWATDPSRNGGPFMDAMIHNLNAARYLIGKPQTRSAFYSDNHAQTLKCQDTESMKLDFEGGASAHLFITWAANLAVYGTEGNDREHIEQLFMVTSQGWLIRKAATSDRAPVGGDADSSGWIATRDGEVRRIPVAPPAETALDGFVGWLEGGTWPRSLVPLAEAAADIMTIAN